MEDFDPHNSAKSPTLAPATQVLVRPGNLGHGEMFLPRSLEMAAVHDERKYMDIYGDIIHIIRRNHFGVESL